MKKTVVYVFACLLCVVCIAQGGTTPVQDVQGGISISGDVAVAAVTVTASNSISIHWTAPADSINRVDSSGNTVVEFNGAATMYEIAYSLTPIDSLTAGNAPSILDSSFIPSNPGETEEYLVVGLNPNTTYYFAVRAADATYYNPNVAPYEPVNWSKWSNVISKSTSRIRITGTTFAMFKAKLNRDNFGDLILYEKITGDWYGAVGDGLGKFTILPGLNGDGVLLRQWGGSDYDPFVGDFSGDGLTDVGLFHRRLGRAFIAFWQLDRFVVSFGPYAGGSWINNWKASATGNEYRIFAADFSKDGFCDLAVMQKSLGRWFLAYNWNDRFAAVAGSGPNSSSLDGWGQDPYESFIADFNRDSIPDVCVYHKTYGRWFVAKKVGNNFVAIIGPYTGGSWLTNWDPNGYIPFVDDFSHDRFCDIGLLSTSLGRWFVGFNWNDRFRPAIGTQIGGSWLTNWAKGDGYDFITLDESGDDFPDLLIREKISGRIFVAFNWNDHFTVKNGTDSAGAWVDGFGAETQPLSKPIAQDQVSSDSSTASGMSSLSQNYPNPFNPATTISYTIPEASHVSLEILNILGQHVETLVDEQQSAGEHSVQWNANQYATGVYFYRFTVGTQTKTKKMLLIK